VPVIVFWRDDAAFSTHALSRLCRGFHGTR
jgi:hypothetical protein